MDGQNLIIIKRYDIISCHFIDEDIFCIIHASMYDTFMVKFSDEICTTNNNSL